MDFTAVASAIGQEYVEPEAARIDADADWPEVAMRELVGQLGGLTIPVDQGGLGGGLRDLADVCRVLGEHCASTSICFGMHCVAAAVISSKATVEQIDRYLEPVVNGECVCGLALSESGSGARFWMPETRMSKRPGGYVVNGTKAFVTSGGHADCYVVSVRAAADDAAAVGDFSCLALPADSDGLTWGTPWRGIGLRGNSSISLTLEDVVVDDAAVLGEIGDQIWFVFEVVAPYFLVAMASAYVGVAHRALMEARGHLQQRWMADRSMHLADDPVLQVQFGELWMDYEAARALVADASERFDRGEDALVPILASKAMSAGAATRIVNGAMTLVGGAGYRSNGVFDRLLRNARAADVMSPTTNLLWQWMGRRVLDRNLLAR